MKFPTTVCCPRRGPVGQRVFERLFIRTIEQCVAAGLVSGDKLHVDSSLVAAHASKDSVVKVARS